MEPSGWGSNRVAWLAELDVQTLALGTRLGGLWKVLLQTTHLRSGPASRVCVATNGRRISLPWRDARWSHHQGWRKKCLYVDVPLCPISISKITIFGKGI